MGSLFDPIPFLYSQKAEPPDSHALPRPDSHSLPLQDSYSLPRPAGRNEAHWNWLA